MTNQETGPPSTALLLRCPEMVTISEQYSPAVGLSAQPQRCDPPRWRFPSTAALRYRRSGSTLNLQATGAPHGTESWLLGELTGWDIQRDWGSESIRCCLPGSLRFQLNPWSDPLPSRIDAADSGNTLQLALKRRLCHLLTQGETKPKFR